MVSYVGRFAPVVAVSLASLRGGEPATKLTSSRSNTTNGDATLPPVGGPPGSSTEPGSEEWLESHGIDPDVWAARGVYPYEQGNPDPVIEAYEPWLRRRGFGKGERRRRDEIMGPRRFGTS